MGNWQTRQCQPTVAAMQDGGVEDLPIKLSLSPPPPPVPSSMQNKASSELAVGTIVEAHSLRAADLNGQKGTLEQTAKGSLQADYPR